MKVRPIDANKLLRVLNSNFGHTGGAAVMKQLIEAQPTLTQPNNVVFMILIQNVDTTKSAELPTGARFQNRLRRISYV